MSMIGRKMAFIFWLIIVLFASIITYFLIKNNFNVETIEIIFPAIGAIVFSLYLGVKYIYIDAPEPQTSMFNIVLVHDTQSGLINPLVMPIAVEPIQHSFEFQGLKKINEYQYELFKGSNVWDTFKSNKVEDVETAITCLVEYAILDWFSEHYTYVGYVDKGTFNSLSGISQSGGAIPKI